MLGYNRRGTLLGSVCYLWSSDSQSSNLHLPAWSFHRKEALINIPTNLRATTFFINVIFCWLFSLHFAFVFNIFVYCIVRPIWSCLKFKFEPLCYCTHHFVGSEESRSRCTCWLLFICRRSIGLQNCTWRQQLWGFIYYIVLINTVYFLYILSVRLPTFLKT